MCNYTAQVHMYMRCLLCSALQEKEKKEEADATPDDDIFKERLVHIENIIPDLEMNRPKEIIALYMYSSI